ncbi:unnamed protein product [Gadus morhua 'NCC']
MRSEESSPRCTTPLHVLLLRCGPDALHLASSTHQSGYTTCKQNLGKCVKMYRFLSLSLLCTRGKQRRVHTRAHTHTCTHTQVFVFKRLPGTAWKPSGWCESSSICQDGFTKGI